MMRREVVVGDDGAGNGRLGGVEAVVVVDGGEGVGQAVVVEGCGEGGGVGGLPAGVGGVSHGSGGASAVVGRHLCGRADRRRVDLQRQLLALGQGGGLQVGGDAGVDPGGGLVLVVDEVGVAGGRERLLPAVGQRQGRGRGARRGGAHGGRLQGGGGGLGGGRGGRLLARVLPGGGLCVVV